MDRARLSALILILALSAACAPPRAGGASGPTAPAERVAPKRIVAAITGDAHTVYNKLNPNSAVRGIPELQAMINRGLTQTDPREVRVPVLAEATPSVENGLWKVLPDGKMETTWTLRPGIVWHDGTPFTTDDLAFTARISSDREIPILNERAFTYVDAVTPLDSRTITVRWKQPYIEADALFGTVAQPVAKHLLEAAYLADKATFTDLPYWSVDFVGEGPYRIRSWERGSHVVLAANDSFTLGRPKIDEIEVRFVLDANTLVANTLGGGVDITMGRGISLDQGVTVRDRWADGTVDMGIPTSAMSIWPQLMNPTPAILTNLQFRKAMFHALNRQEMVDTIQFGLTSVIHSGANTKEPEFPLIDAQTVKYEYDPRKAAQMLTDLGYSRGGDGQLRDAQSARLELEFRTITGDINQKTILASTDQWRSLGVAVEPVIIPSQRQNDRPYRATFPAFELLRGPQTFTNLVSSAARVPENDFNGMNYPRYMNPDFDGLVDRYNATIPRVERMQVAAQGYRHVSENVLNLPLFSDGQPNFISNRVRGVIDIATTGPWNVHQWE
jgi:peptide/nickel transport system substrate-binding protein